MFSVPKAEKVEGEEGDVPPPEQAGPVGQVPDMLAESKVWQWAGVGFGEYDTMLLQKSMIKLARTQGSTQLRLWGKIKGTEKDYYIAEGNRTVVEEGEPPV